VIEIARTRRFQERGPTDVGTRGTSTDVAGEASAPTYVLGEQALAMVIGQVRAEIEAQLPKLQDDIASLEDELTTVRAEQKRLAKADALADDVPELVAELQQRSARIQNLEAQLIAARRPPGELAGLIDRVEANVRANAARLRQALVDEPARTPNDSRQIWKISGNADFAALLGSKRSDRGFECVATPTGFEFGST
jgi:uncharacterized protein YoxC